ncbi:putative Rab-GTPase-TBC domain containing protein [Trypanosoma cruzi]|nr:putative Rab-GTPase-TBC domain containing protein [Trypanosoma cruzi]
MPWAKPQTTRATPVPDARPSQRGKPRHLPSATPTPTLPRWLNPAGAEKRCVASSQKLEPETDATLHLAQRGLEATAPIPKFDWMPNVNEASNSGNISKVLSQEALQPSSVDEKRGFLSVMINKQNSEWNSRRLVLLERRDREIHRQVRKDDEDVAKQHSESSCPLCIFLHSLLAESREEWREALSLRVNELKREVRYSAGAALPARRDGNEGDDVEWSVAQLYKTLVTGLNSTATEELLTSRLFGGDVSLCHDNIDSFGLLTVFRAPIQELLAQHEELAPSLTILRRSFAALHPSNGCPKTISHTEISAHDAEENTNKFLQFADSPGAVAKALRGRVSPSLRRLLYARALQLSIIVTDGSSLFGGRGELQVNRHCDGVERFLTFATKHGRDKVRRRIYHSYATKEQEITAKVIQAIVKVDNSQSVGNSDKYFIFSDETELLVVSLLMDRSLPEVHMKNTLRLMGRSSEQIESYLVFLEENNEETGPRQRRPPPSGFFPVRCFSLLVAPVCYITGDTVEQYELVSSLFGQLWGRIQGPTPELAQCCWIFEALIARFAAPACLHATRTLGLPPLRLAIQWMVTAFVEVLEPAELLAFWDLILSYHIEEIFAGRTSLSVHIREGVESGVEKKKKEMEGEEKEVSSFAPSALWLLPLLAASLFVYRAPLVERCATAEEMLVVFKDGHHLRCRPLLQYLLFMAK